MVVWSRALTSGYHPERGEARSGPAGQGGRGRRLVREAMAQEVPFRPAGRPAAFSLAPFPFLSPGRAIGKA